MSTVFRGTPFLLLLVLACRTARDDQITLPFYLDRERTPMWIAPGTPGYATIHKVADFALTDQDGAVVSAATTRGKVYVASFFFADCRQLCPRLQTNLARVQQAFRDDSMVMILTHSVSPIHDDTATLHRYAHANGIISAKWRLLTGPIDVINRLARDSYFAALPDTIDGVARPLLHSETFVLVDAERRVRGVYDGSLMYDVDRLIADIHTLK